MTRDSVLGLFDSAEVISMINWQCWMNLAVNGQLLNDCYGRILNCSSEMDIKWELC